MNEYKIHNLKILPEYFEAVVRGEKTFEIRKNNRDFKVGDLIFLLEWNGEEFTDRYAMRLITYITDYAQKADYIVFSMTDNFLYENYTNECKNCEYWTDKIGFKILMCHCREHIIPEAAINLDICNGFKKIEAEEL